MQEPSPQRAPAWGAPQQEFSVLDFVLIYATYFASGIVFYGLATAVFANPQGSTRIFVILLMTLLSNAVCIVGFVFLGRVRDQRSWTSLGLRWPSLGELGRWSLLFFPVTIAFSIVYGLVLKYILHLPTPTQQVATYFHYEHPLWIRLFALFVVLISAPVTEELIYRGVLHKAIRSRFPLYLAAGLSGLVFGVVHFEISALVPLVFLGFMFAVVYEKTGSLPLAMFLHCVNNALAFTLVLVKEYANDVEVYQWIVWEWVLW